MRGSNELVGLAFEGVRGSARGGRYDRHLLLRLRISRRWLNWVWSVAGRLGFSSGAVEMQDRYMAAWPPSSSAGTNRDFRSS